jgi:hypothetical protein
MLLVVQMQMLHLSVDQTLEQVAPQMAMLLVPLLLRRQTESVQLRLQAGQMEKIQSHHHYYLLNHLILDMFRFLPILNSKLLLLEVVLAALLGLALDGLVAMLEIALLLPFPRLLIHL